MFCVGHMACVQYGVVGEWYALHECEWLCYICFERWDLFLNMLYSCSLEATTGHQYGSGYRKPGHCLGVLPADKDYTGWPWLCVRAILHWRRNHQRWWLQARCCLLSTRMQRKGGEGVCVISTNHAYITTPVHTLWSPPHTTITVPTHCNIRYMHYTSASCDVLIYTLLCHFECR